MPNLQTLHGLPRTVSVLWAFALSVVLSFAVVGRAVAHPHVWIYTSVSVPVVNQKIDRIHTKWNFDEMYGASLIAEADEDASGKLEPYEVQKLFATTLANTAEILPFMYFNIGGKKVDSVKFENFKAWIDDDGSLFYSFDAMLPESYDAVGKHKIGFFDPTQYMAFEQDLNITFTGEGASMCTSELETEESISLSFNLAHPEIYTVVCSAKK